MLVISIDGGLVQGVYSEDEALVGTEVIVQDFDSEGSEDFVTDADGRDCYLHRLAVEAIPMAEATETALLCDKCEDLEEAPGNEEEE